MRSPSLTFVRLLAAIGLCSGTPCCRHDAPPQPQPVERNEASHSATASSTVSPPTTQCASRLPDHHGVGLVISMRNGRLTVVSPIQDSPAFRAGLEPGDIITQVDSTPSTSITIGAAQNMLTGEAGSTVVLWIERAAWPEPRPIAVVRGAVRVWGSGPCP